MSCCPSARPPDAEEPSAARSSLLATQPGKGTRVVPRRPDNTPRRPTTALPRERVAGASRGFGAGLDCALRRIPPTWERPNGRASRRVRPGTTPSRDRGGLSLRPEADCPLPGPMTSPSRCQSAPSPAAASPKHSSSSARPHPGSKAVFLIPFPYVRLKRALHEILPDIPDSWDATRATAAVDAVDERRGCIHRRAAPAPRQPRPQDGTLPSPTIGTVPSRTNNKRVTHLTFLSFTLASSSLS